MKTKIFGIVAIVCIAFAASFIANNVSKSSFALSMVAAANVEALAVDDKDNQPGDVDFPWLCAHVNPEHCITDGDMSFKGTRVW